MANFMENQRRNSRFKALCSTLIIVVGCLLMVNFASAFDWSDGTIVHYYKFDTNSGTSAFDELGLSNFTSWTSTPAWVAPGKLGISKIRLDGILDNLGSSTQAQKAVTGFTYSFWVNLTSNSRGDIYVESTGGVETQIRIDANRVLNFIRDDRNIVGYTINALNEWNHLVFSGADGGNISIWVNGTNVANNTEADVGDSGTNMYFGSNAGGAFNFSGDIDEFGIWNRSLSASEIEELWNFGAGLSFEGASSNLITTTLVSPSNESLISTSSSNFSSSFITNNFALKNATYYIWFTNGTAFNVTTFTMDPAVSNTSLELFNDFGLGNYVWNVEGTGDNATGTFSFFASNNNSFTVSPFNKLDEYWLNTTIEGSTDLFTVNISLLTGFRLSSVKFYYNDTPYATSFTEYATNNYFVQRTHSIPLVSSNTNVTFYWNVTLEDGNSAFSTTQNQTILDLSIDNCSTNTFVIFNFTMVDEDTQALLNGITDNTMMDIDLVLTSLANGFLPLNYSGQYNQTNPAAVCTNVDFGSSNFRTDALVEYSATNRFIEYYNIQNYILTNTTGYQNITLYNLNSTKGTEFKITYKDSNFNLVPGAIIQIQRKYISEGIFKTVEIPKIGSAGYTIAHLIRNDAIYNLVILKDGVILDSFNNIVADCQNPSLSECTININSFSSGISPESFSDIGDFSASLTYNQSTRIITSNFVIPSGVSTVTTLNVTLLDGLGTTIVCTDSLNAAGGTLTCTIPISFGNSTVIAQIYSGGELKVQRTVRLAEDPSAIYGSSLVFLGLIIVLLIIGMSITENPMIMGIMLIFGVIILVALNLVNSYGWIGPGATILWLVVAIIIVLIKGSNRQ